MKNDIKKETSFHAGKQSNEVLKDEKEKTFSTKLYSNISPLSTPLQKLFQASFLDERHCVKCGKLFIKRTSEYKWEDCCSYTCWLHRDDDKKIVNAKPVLQITKKGTVVSVFPSVVAAAFAMGIANPDTIRKCCKGITKTSCGYVWRYKEEIE